MNSYLYEPFLNFESNLSLFEEHNELYTYTNYFSNDNQLSTTVLYPNFEKANYLMKESFVNKSVLNNELQTHENGFGINTNEQPLFYSSLTEQKFSPVFLNQDLGSQQEAHFETQSQMHNFDQTNEENLITIANGDFLFPSHESPKPLQMENHETESNILNLDKNEDQKTTTNTNSFFINRNKKIGFDFFNYESQTPALFTQSPTTEKELLKKDSVVVKNNHPKTQRKRLYEENENENENERINYKIETNDIQKIRRKNNDKKERKEPKRRPNKSKPKSKKNNKSNDYEINSVIIPSEKGKRVKIFKRRKPTRSERLKTTEYAKTLFENWFTKHLNRPEGPYPDKNTRKSMSEKTGIPELQVTRWFGQRRRLQRLLWENKKVQKPNWIN
ncbi:hypothetical protein M0812_10854 [Anaeramoeba flamelloides]|uniref:Homeobox domain-containing protein n=1 Tax=Anaeramoeba flamelloides TaxID=1746091 RepID=A0AAV7ZSL4_9EUKA|nr:hypothetical protein M0812_10854 [Anaeramoeba flamelloides]